jgi:hypothetical protein
MRRTILLAMAGLAMAVAQDVPRINPDGIIPNQPGPRQLPKPGMEVSIYGRHLGPETGCTADAGGWTGAKTELCGTSVTVGGRPAELLYVQEIQINARVPYSVPTEGVVPFVVTRNGRSSVPAPVRFGPYRAVIKPPPTAYVGMPIWIEVNLPDPLWHSLRYPITIRPADFGGHQFEVRRHGVLLQPNSMPHPLPVAGGGLGTVGMVGSGSLVGLPHEPKDPRRLPLHLLYRFDTPGVYEVRYVGYDFRYPIEKHLLVRSPWVRIHIEPLPLAKRQAWLASMAKAKPGDPVEWVSDYVPSLLALPDAGVLPLLKGALYNPNGLVRQYTVYALSLFDDKLLSGWIPEVIKTDGSTPELAYLLSWRRNLFGSQGSDIARALLPYLKSTSPVSTAGALQTLYFLKWQYDWSGDPEIPALMDRGVSSEADRLIATHSAEILQPFALYLGMWKSDTSRRLLQRLVAEGTVREQAQICLRWINKAPKRP